MLQANLLPPWTSSNVLGRLRHLELPVPMLVNYCTVFCQHLQLLTSLHLTGFHTHATADRLHAITRLTALVEFKLTIPSYVPECVPDDWMHMLLCLPSLQSISLSAAHTSGHLLLHFPVPQLQPYSKPGCAPLKALQLDSFIVSDATGYFSNLSHLASLALGAMMRTTQELACLLAVCYTAHISQSCVAGGGTCALMMAKKHLWGACRCLC